MTDMIMNYDNWFYNQHKYTAGSRDGKKSFNDTKWINMNKRYETLVELESELLNEQPFAVMGNNNGFDRLIDLMARSNYTFEDINESLIDTYQMSLRNAKSRNLVNTHAVMFHCTNNDSSNVTPEKFTHYWIIDAPFNQLHFGDRDEFIRQKLHDMHTTESGRYMDITRFINSEISRILGFTIICTVNGYFSNDCKIAIDDKGFKFKIGWPYSSDVDFIIYKLDESIIFSRELPSKQLYNTDGIIPYSTLGNIVKDDVVGKKCIINIYDKRFVKTTPSAPNFGIFTDKGLEIRNLQQITINTIDRQSTDTITMDIYAIKYLHEVPDTYPAVNYHDIMESRHVLTERHEYVKNTNGDNILVSNTNNINHLETCTPPIVLDRNVHYSFDIMRSCVTMYDSMMEYEKDLKTVGSHILMDSWNYDRFVENDKPLLDNMYKMLIKLYNTYQQGAMLTSLVSIEEMDTFTLLINNIKALKDITDYRDIQKYTFDELYESNYKATVTTITNPFRTEKLSNFTNIGSISNNFFTSDNSTRFNRPIAEQNFITLRYNRDDECWLFDYPEIKHFNGIGNTFYIDTNLEGNEIFKFFVLYTDTEGVSETNIDSFDSDTIFDFDRFSKEVDKHMGCIRYWDAENRIMKLSRILYNKYDDETCVQIFSKILKRKLSCDDLLSVYPSEINYEASNITSDNWDNYDENTERSPFAINFMFYTLSMLNNNEDKLQSYFYRQLTNKKYNNRYADIDISSIIDDERYPVSYSQYTIAPSTLSNDYSKPVSPVIVYYGLPLILSQGVSDMYEPYRYVLNVYNPDVEFPLLTSNDINKDYYVKYDDITNYGGKVVSYHDDINAGRLCTLYLSALYDYISDLETNYKTSYNQSSTIESARNTINKHISTITSFVDNTNFANVEGLSNTSDTLALIINDNQFINILDNIQQLTNKILSIRYNSRNISIIEFFNQLLSTMKHIYVTNGFDNNIARRARMLYINLKSINTTMNLYEYKKWLSELDIFTLENLDKMIAKNINYKYSPNTFSTYFTALKSYIDSSNDIIDELIDCVNNITNNLQESHINPITKFCDDVINHYIFDLFIMNNIVYDSSTQYSSKPEYLVIPISDTDHICPPIGTTLLGTRNLIFQPITECVDGKYYIRSISNICEYVFFNGKDIEGLTMNVIDKNGDVISTQTVSMSFTRIASTADRVNTFDQLVNVRNTSLEFENTHESFDVVNNLIVNKKHADMNYEMLIGNHFIPLDHEIELILHPETWLQGSVDKLYISNQVINRMSASEFSHKNCRNVFFKPSQVFHITPNENGSIDSIAGKYFEGQTIYLSTEDGLTIFPVIITSVDHSINKGFIEAKVDSWNAKWFEVSDPDTISKYLTTNITCSVIDDNIRNFMDEFSNSSYTSYSNPSTVSFDNGMNDIYSLPGDPLFVSKNSEFVYNRLNWFFNELVPNRFIDEEHKTHHFVYIASGFINDENDELKINMINHDFDQLTNPEKYPILRDEPNDHYVWDNEIATFKQYQAESYRQELSLNRFRSMAVAALENAKTIYEKERIINEIDGYDRKIQKQTDFRKRLELYIRQLETPTTWFNVRSYDATLVYIANGRADRFSPSVISNIRDLPYNDKLNVFIYDWEHKMWLDPNTYTINIDMIDNIKIGEHDNYTTNRVLHTITIKPSEGFNFSKKLLVYFSYDKSDVFDDIEMNNDTCLVRFKPLLSLDNEINQYDPYSDIRIRKHFDGYEKYSYNINGEDTSIHVKRINRSGKYTYSPTFRVCDITFTDDNGEHTYEDIDKFLVPNPFKDVNTTRVLHKPTFRTLINSEVDSFVPNVNIKLICISNNENSSYDGNISDVMFDGVTVYTDDGSQSITITGSTLPNFATGTFICTVFKDSKYKPRGGVITVTVESDTEEIFDKWINIPKEFLKYREIPDEFMFTTKEPINGSTVDVILKNTYVRNIDDDINDNNSGINNPFEYYYDSKNNIRLPISDTRINSSNKRLVIDKDTNENIELIKSTYIGICRYSAQRIPKDGFIDLTGYIPTPLSRDRYEFWINGRCIKDEKNIIILSPTSIQLCNMKSLRNFEVIELVDDVDTNSDILKRGNVYIDMNGNSYGSYQLAMLSNANIRQQDIMFSFNANNHKHIHDYTSCIIENPNNNDLEEDILSSITFNSDINDYNKLYNIPSINGVTIFHPDISGIGISEIPNERIIDMFDKIWKFEETTNPLFTMTHRDGIGSNIEEGSELHVKQITDNHWNGLPIDTRGMFIIYATGVSEKYFSLYISKKSNGKIDDIENTVKIIPFISNGVYVLIDSKYKGMWLHSTQRNTTPIHIVNINK